MGICSRVKAAGLPPWDLRNSIAWSASKRRCPSHAGDGRAEPTASQLVSPVQPGWRWRTLRKWQCAGCTGAVTCLTEAETKQGTSSREAFQDLGPSVVDLLWRTTRHRPAEERRGSVADFTGKA